MCVGDLVKSTTSVYERVCVHALHSQWARAQEQTHYALFYNKYHYIYICLWNTLSTNNSLCSPSKITTRTHTHKTHLYRVSTWPISLRIYYVILRFITIFYRDYCFKTNITHTHTPNICTSNFDTSIKFVIPFKKKLYLLWKKFSGKFPLKYIWSIMFYDAIVCVCMCMFT